MVHKGVRYLEENGHLVVIGLDKVSFSGTVTIPNVIKGKPVMKIADEAFQGTLIKKVYIPYNCGYIGDRAFSYCSHLETVETNITTDKARSTGILEIGVNAFSACQKLKTVKTNQSLVLRNYAFTNCINLQRIDSILLISEKSLYGCDQLNTLFFKEMANVQDFVLKHSAVKKCEFFGNAKISDKFIASLVESGCNVECFSDSNLCDLLYMGVNINIEELPF